MAQDETDRRLKMRERLQNRLRCRQQNGPMTVDRLLKLCEEDLTKLMAQIDLCAPMGFPLESHFVFPENGGGSGGSTGINFREVVQTIKWTTVIECIEQTLTTCDMHMDSHQRKHLGAGRKALLNKPMVVHLEEAKFIHKRLKHSVAKLPQDLAITNPEELGLRTKRRVMINSKEAPGRSGVMDTNGHTEFG